MVGPTTALDFGESLVKESRANLQRGVETVGGRLFLTTRRLLFESHKLNVQTGTTVIDLRTITGVTKGWTKFLNVLPLAPNTIVVTTSDGAEHRVVCSKRGDWMTAIDQQRAGASAATAD
ncbi:hypothetical protein BH20ACT18_BH20ACT18_12170 [soil metagenome]